MVAQSQAGRWRCVSMCRVNVELRNRVEWGASTTTMVVTVRKRNAFAEPVERRNNKSGPTLVRSFFILQSRTLINTRVPFWGQDPGYQHSPVTHFPRASTFISIFRIVKCLATGADQQNKTTRPISVDAYCFDQAYHGVCYRIHWYDQSLIHQTSER